MGAAFTERQDPLDVLVRIIHSESLKREDVQRGCPLLNLSQEMSGLDEGFRSRTAKVFKDWHVAVAKVRREGQKRGAVRNDINANETAAFLIAAYEGYVVLGKNSQDARMLQSGQRSVIRHCSRCARRAAGRERQALSEFDIPSCCAMRASLKAS